MALDCRQELADVLNEMGIHEEINSVTWPHKKYPVFAETAKEVLDDLRRFLDALGIEQPETGIELIDDPWVQCMRIKDPGGLE